MSVYSAKDFNSQKYNNFRPTYPNDFYELLIKYHEGPRELAIDVGCGPGTASFQLASVLKSFKKIIGTDISHTMVQTAKQLQSVQKIDRLSFEVSASERFDFLGPEEVDKQVCDMVTAAECAHWFDFGRFQESVAHNLRAGGTIAIWGYSDALFVDYPDLDDLMNGITYDMDKLGSYWQQPGREILRRMYRERTLDDSKFTDIKTVSLHATDYRSVEPTQIDPKPLKVCKRQTIIQYGKYIKTWSAYHSWKKDHRDEAVDIVDSWIEDVLQLHPEMAHEPHLVAWNTFYSFGRRL